MQYGEMAVCPSCEKEFLLDEIYEAGDIIICTNCSSKLKIISLHPAVLEIFKTDKNPSKKTK